MKRFMAALLAASLLSLPVAALSADGDQAPAPHKGKGKVIAQSTVSATAEVKAVDQEKRTVTLAFPDGHQQTLVVGKAVKKLKQVQVGDMVNIRYYEAISVKINKTKVPAEVAVSSVLETDKSSVKPAGAVARQVTTVATIEKVMDDSKKVALRFPSGEVFDVKVRDPENVKKLKSGEVKVGDQVEITYTQALALAVEKVKQQ